MPSAGYVSDMAGVRTEKASIAEVRRSRPYHALIGVGLASYGLLHLVLAWGFVGIPLGWGVIQTVINALKLFQ